MVARSVLTSAVCTVVNAHGAMESPRPWNNEGEIQETSLKLSINGSAVVQSDCDGTQRAQYSLDECVSLSGPGVVVSLQRPPPNVSSKVIVDCTVDDICHYGDSSDPQQDSADDEVLWFYNYINCDPASSRFPLAVFKLKADHCTTFPAPPEPVGCGGQSCEWFSQGCTIGCDSCTESNTDFENNLCGSTMVPTLDDKYKTWNLDGTVIPPSGVAHDWTSSHPWRSPGNAPVLDACGMAGGSTKDNSGAGGYPPPGHVAGDLGSKLNTTGTTVWKASAVVEVAWSIAANHGGGYQYRLCPKSEQLTEECFQQTPLPFAGTTQTLRWQNGSSIEIPAALVSEGTTPAGSTWAKNPIPACKSFSGGFREDGCEEPQFEPPEGCNSLCWGYQPSPGVPREIPSIVDSLQLPDDLAPGRYVLGFRWDCEQTPQIWSSCSDIEITAGDELVIV